VLSRRMNRRCAASSRAKASSNATLAPKNAANSASRKPGKPPSGPNARTQNQIQEDLVFVWTTWGEKGVGETPVSPWRKAGRSPLENRGFPKSRSDESG